jgi:hypothetical protein
MKDLVELLERTAEELEILHAHVNLGEKKVTAKELREKARSLPPPVPDVESSHTETVAG